MAKKLMFAIVFLLACGAAGADELKTRGAYIGGSAGSAEFDDDGAFGGFIDDLDTSIMVFGGYQFFKNFGVEARLGSLGSFSDGIDTLELTSLSVHAVGIIPFGTSGWELIGQLGVAQVNQKVAGFYNDDDSAGSAGIGVRWHINQSIAVGAQVDAYVWQNDEIGPLYDLAVTTSQLSFQFSF